MQQSRIRTIDAGRGAAMLFVFLSHFAEYYLISNLKYKELHYLWRVTMIASPTFMLISGITLGYLFSAKRNNFVPTQRKFVDRGLFLITIAHLLIYFSWKPYIGFSHATNWVMFITDTIGFCLIVAPILITRIKPKLRIALSLFLYSISWVLICAGDFQNLFINIIVETFFGHINLVYLFDCFPVLPWFSLYLIGTVLGEKVFFYQQNGQPKDISRFFFKTGLYSIATSIVLIFIYKTLKSKGITILSENVLEILQYTQKNPPGLAYILLYGGAGMIMLSILSKLIENNRFSVLINKLEIIGKTSLFAFIIQYYMYFSIVVWIHPPYWKIWPLFFIATMIVNIILINFWYNKGLNKYLTVLDFPLWKKFKISKKVLNTK